MLKPLHHRLRRGAREAAHSALPHDLKRSLFKLLFPVKHRRSQRLRATTGRWSYKPFDEHKCIFVHIPKTAGISVARSLFGHQGGGHADIWRYQLVFGREEFDSYFKFTFVRNPWDRLVSAYSFLKGGGMNEEDRRWAARHLSGYDDFDSFVRGWVNRRNIYKGLHLIPQYEFVCINGSAPLVDFVGRFESLQEDFRHIRAMLGVECELQKLNMGRRRDYRDYYTRETAQIVAEVYREDIEIFRYDFDDAHPAGDGGV